MNVTTIFSALGNNSSSLVPIIIKDSVIENAGKTYMSYRQGSKVSKEYGRHEARERAIEEYATSAVWLGGIPLLKSLFNRTVYPLFGLKPGIDNQLLFAKKGSSQIYEGAKKALHKKLAVSRFAVSTALPVAFLALALPKLNYALTKQKQTQKVAPENEKANEPLGFLSFTQSKDGNLLDNYNKLAHNKIEKKEVAFSGIGELMANPVLNMKLVDYGLSTGRVVNGRTTEEKIEFVAKEAALIYMIYEGGKQIQKGLEWAARKIGVPIELDPKVMDSKELKDIVKSDNLRFTLPKEISEDEILKMIDNGGKTEAEKVLVDMSKKSGIFETLENGARDKTKFVEVDDVKGLAKNMDSFLNKAKGSLDFIKKAQFYKRASILLNLGICSFTAAILLPKMQFMIREALTGNSASSGILKSERDVKEKAGLAA